jgi:hypothetical protein
MAIAFIIFTLVVGIGALVGGRDSRIDENARRRRYLG